MLEVALLLSSFFFLFLLPSALWLFATVGCRRVSPLKRKKNKTHTHYQDKVDVVFFFYTSHMLKAVLDSDLENMKLQCTILSCGVRMTSLFRLLTFARKEWQLIAFFFPHLLFFCETCAHSTTIHLPVCHQYLSLFFFFQSRSSRSTPPVPKKKRAFFVVVVVPFG